MLELLGFLIMVLGLGWVTVVTILIGLYGGEEFSHIAYRNLWWYLPVVCGVVWLWGVLLNIAPFSVTLS